MDVRSVVLVSLEKPIVGIIQNIKPHPNDLDPQGDDRMPMAQVRIIFPKAGKTTTISLRSLRDLGFKVTPEEESLPAQELFARHIIEIVAYMQDMFERLASRGRPYAS